MKNLPLYIQLMVFICLMFSCKKTGLCKDKEFSFERKENHTNKVRIDGYYYGDLSERNSDYFLIYLLYQNGISNNSLSFRKEVIEGNSLKLNVNQDEKSGWGIYRVDGDHIEIQNWTFSTECKPVITQKGVILNDTTIRITSWQNSNSEKMHSVNAIFRFRKYSPKPDNTNIFIP